MVDVNRLTKRRLDWAEAGFKGELWTTADLNPTERTFLQNIITMRTRKLTTDEEVAPVYVGILHMYGIICPHPLLANTAHKATCTVCGCAVFSTWLNPP